MKEENCQPFFRKISVNLCKSATYLLFSQMIASFSATRYNRFDVFCPADACGGAHTDPFFQDEHIMVDCALSQFSYGKLETTRLAGKQLPVAGGYDADGNLTTDPAAEEKWAEVLAM